MNNKLRGILSPKSNFQIDDRLLESLLRSFYGVLLVIDYWYFLPLLKLSSTDGAVWLWPVKVLNYFEPGQQLIGLKILFLSAVLTHLGCVISPAERIFKAAAAVVFFLMMAALYSFGKIDHFLYGFLFASFTLSFLKPFAKEENQRNHFYFWATQVFVLGTYTLSGLWKIRYFVEQLFNGWESFTNPLLVQISWDAIQSFSKTSELALVQHRGLGIALWICAMIFETFAVACAWFPRTQRFVGVGIVLLHMSTAYFLNIYYTPAALLAVILFCSNPYVYKQR